MRIQRALFFVAGMLAGLTGMGWGQGETHPMWTEKTVTEVKPERRQKFEAYLKELSAAYRRAGTAWFLVEENLAGDTLEYTTIVPVLKFGDMDDPSALVRVLGKEKAEDLLQSLASCSTAQTRQYETPQNPLEIDKKAVPEGVYWVETKTMVEPGRWGEYLTWLQHDYRPALEKAGVAHFRVSQPIFGAAAGELIAARNLHSLAEIDAGAVLSKALTDDEIRALNAKSAVLVRSSYTRIVRVRGDLGYTAKR